MKSEEIKFLNSCIDLAINHIIEKGSDDIFKPPIFSSSPEQDIIKNNVTEFRKKAKKDVTKFINIKNLEIEPIGEVRKTLVAKDHFTFRQASWLDPFDAVKFLSISLILFEKIESSRLPKSLNIIHSHRRSDNDNEIFDANYGYDSFRKISGEISREYSGKWKVITDISNFFDRIGNHSLENHLLNIGCDKKYTDILREILLFWSGDRRSYGVPVGSDASRIISEAALIDIDKQLHEKGVKFIRYVDDYRIFAETRSKAYEAIEILTYLLADEGLSLNSKKTSIVNIKNEDDLSHESKEFTPSEHEVINVDEKIPVNIRSSISGKTTISRYYKEPGKDAINSIKKLTSTEIKDRINKSTPNSEEDNIKLGVKHFIYADQDIETIRFIIKHKITSLFYIVDALIKESDKIEKSIRMHLKSIIISEVNHKECATPFKIPIIRLVSSIEYQCNVILWDIFDTIKVSDNVVFYREFILLSYKFLDRARIRKLSLEIYPTVPNCVKRIIMHAVKNHPILNFDEKRPLLKNMKQGSDDWFVRLL